MRRSGPQDRSVAYAPIVNSVTNTQPEQYCAYLLRLWLVERNDKRVWRVSLENVHTGERRGFASLGALTRFLQEMEKTRQQARTPDENE